MGGDIATRQQGSDSMNTKGAKALRRFRTLLSRDELAVLGVIGFYLYLYRGALLLGAFYKGDLAGGFLSFRLLADRFWNGFIPGIGSLNDTQPFYYFQSLLNATEPHYALGEKFTLLVPEPLAAVAAYMLLSSLGVSRRISWLFGFLYSLTPLVVFNSLFVEPPTALFLAVFPLLVKGLYRMPEPDQDWLSLLRLGLLLAIVVSFSLQNLVLLAPFFLALLVSANRRAALRLLRRIGFVVAVALAPSVSYLFAFLGLPLVGYATQGGLSARVASNEVTFQGYSSIGNYWGVLLLLMFGAGTALLIVARWQGVALYRRDLSFLFLVGLMVPIFFLPPAGIIALTRIQPLSVLFNWQTGAIVGSLAFLLMIFDLLSRLRIEPSRPAVSPDTRSGHVSRILVITVMILFAVGPAVYPFHESSLQSLLFGVDFRAYEVPRNFQRMSDWLIEHGALEHLYNTLVFPIPPNYGYFLNNYALPSFVPNLLLIPGEKMLALLTPIAANSTRQYGDIAASFGVKYIIVNFQTLPQGYLSDNPGCGCTYYPGRNFNTGPPAYVKQGIQWLPVGSPNAYAAFFSQQKDLRLVFLDADFLIFENEAFRAVRSYSSVVVVPPSTETLFNSSYYQESPNLLRNSNLADLRYWDVVGQGNFSAITTGVGQFAVRIEVPFNSSAGGHWASLVQTVAVESDSSYTFAVGLAYEGVNQTAVRLAFYDRNGTYLGSSYPFTRRIGDASMTKIFHNFTTPSSANSLVVFLSGGWGLAQSKPGVTIFSQPVLVRSFFHTTPLDDTRAERTVLTIPLDEVPELERAPYLAIADSVVTTLPVSPSTQLFRAPFENLPLYIRMAATSVLNPESGNWTTRESTLSGAAPTAIGIGLARASIGFWLPYTGLLNLTLDGILSGDGSVAVDGEGLPINYSAELGTKLLQIVRELRAGWHRMSLTVNFGTLFLWNVTLSLAQNYAGPPPFLTAGTYLSPRVVWKGNFVYEISSLPQHSSIFLVFPQPADAGFVLKYETAELRPLRMHDTGGSLYRVVTTSETSALLFFAPQNEFASLQAFVLISTVSVVALAATGKVFRHRRHGAPASGKSVRGHQPGIQRSQGTHMRRTEGLDDKIETSGIAFKNGRLRWDSPVLSPQPSPMCPACGEEIYLTLFVAHDLAFRSPGGWTLEQCATCGLARTTGPHKGFGELYPQEYVFSSSHWGYLRESFQRLQTKLTRSLEYRALFDLDGHPPGRALDIGCGFGNYLSTMQTRGWSVLGIEPNVSSASHAFAKGVPVVVGTLDCVEVSGQFDLITLNHVLEHIPDPQGTLTRCNRLLRPDGHITIAVPNFDSSERHFFAKSWFQVEVPRHLYHFTPSALFKLLDRCHFDVVKVAFDNRLDHVLPSMLGQAHALHWVQRHHFLHAAIAVGSSFLNLFYGPLLCRIAPSRTSFVVLAQKCHVEGGMSSHNKTVGKNTPHSTTLRALRLS